MTTPLKNKKKICFVIIIFFSQLFAAANAQLIDSSRMKGPEIKTFHSKILG